MYEKSEIVIDYFVLRMDTMHSFILFLLDAKVPSMLPRFMLIMAGTSTRTFVASGRTDGHIMPSHYHMVHLYEKSEIVMNYFVLCIYLVVACQGSNHASTLFADDHRDENKHLPGTHDAYR